MKKRLTCQGIQLVITPYIGEPTVQVTGIGDKIHDEALELFFENFKKSGGGEIKKLESVRSKHMAIITFRDQMGRIIFTPLLLFCSYWIKS